MMTRTGRASQGRDESSGHDSSSDAGSGNRYLVADAPDQPIVREPRPLRRPMKFPKYAEGISMPNYMAAVQEVTRHNRWDEQEGAMQLRASLEGKVLKLALAHPTYGLTELRELFVTRFAEEQSVAWNAALDLKWSKGMSVEDLGDEVRRLAQLAYATMRPADRETQSVAVFTRALDQPTITFQIETLRITTLNEAVQLAKRMDSCRKRRTPTTTGKEGRPTLRALTEWDEASSSDESDLDPVEALRAELRQLRGEMDGSRVSWDNVICHRCQGNHFIRGCPHPSGYKSGGEATSTQKAKPRQTRGKATPRPAGDRKQTTGNA